MRVNIGDDKFVCVELDCDTETYAKLLDVISLHVGFVPTKLSLILDNGKQRVIECPSSTRLCDLSINETTVLHISEVLVINVSASDSSEAHRELEVGPSIRRARFDDNPVRSVHEYSNTNAENGELHYDPFENEDISTIAISRCQDTLFSSEETVVSDDVFPGVILSYGLDYFVEHKNKGNYYGLLECIIKCVGRAELVAKDLHKVVCKEAKSKPDKYDDIICNEYVDLDQSGIRDISYLVHSTVLPIMSQEFKIGIYYIDLTESTNSRILGDDYDQMAIIAYNGKNTSYIAATPHIGGHTEREKTLFESVHVLENAGDPFGLVTRLFQNMNSDI